MAESIDGDRIFIIHGFFTPEECDRFCRQVTMHDSCSTTRRWQTRFGTGCENSSHRLSKSGVSWASTSAFVATGTIRDRSLRRTSTGYHAGQR